MLFSIVLGSNTATEKGKREVRKTRGLEEGKAADGCQEEHQTEIAGIYRMDR